MKGPTRPTRLLIVDQSLRDLDGHYYEYDLAIARGAMARGWNVLVAANNRMQPTLTLDAAELRPWFSRASHETSQAPMTRAALGVIRHLPRLSRGPAVQVGSLVKRGLTAIWPQTAAIPAASDFGAQVFDLIAEQRLAPGDHVLIHTVSVPELSSLIETFAATSAPLPFFHIVLRRDADEPSVKDGPTGGIFGSFARVRALVDAARYLRFYADTQLLAEQYRDLSCGVPVTELPIPHCLPERSPSPRFRGRGPLTIAYLGNARREKGFHLLPAVVSELANDGLRTGRARFVIQSNFNIDGGEPGIAQAKRQLRIYPESQVRLIDQPLAIAEFQAQLLAADIVLLPYDRALYRRRSSGILVQALAVGCPVVVPSDTWLAREAREGTAVVYDDDSRLAASVWNAIERWPALKRAASAHMPYVRRRTDVQRLLDVLLLGETA